MRRFLSNPGGEICCAARGKDSITHRRRFTIPAVENECLVGELLQRKGGLASGEGMALRQSHDPRLLQQWMKSESTQFGEIHPDERGIESIIFDGFHQFARNALGYCHGPSRQG